MKAMLTPRRKQILEYLEHYIEQHGYAPTIQEIGRHFHLSSTATVHKHLTALEQLGLIERSQHRSRAIEFKGVADEGPPQVPMLGKIAAGRPIEAVQGDSMIDEGIFDKDTIVVLTKQTAENGQIVVALVDSQYATVNKFYSEKQHVRLQPANERHKPLVLEPERVQIQGVVIGVIRRY